ncbi:SCL-interrupting locus protein homolog [Synchiropus splendidus]|uniref:SCL-interrupting locus protein homolog n=1 Tax=Synchiropus splendidus TaxID=270530 RepID=UPI00237D6DE4|nr:SCL-interrupting locus protein homolog [Synchiropus splendidus]
MSFPVNFQALPAGVFEEVFNPENVRARNTGNTQTTLSFPKSRTALWDGSPTGDTLHLQLCSQRNPRVLLLEKALRLAQLHARHGNKPRIHCFFLGSVSVDSDEDGVTVTLDRFDPGREQSGGTGRVPSALLPGDVLVPCMFSSMCEGMSDTVVQSEADLHLCFKGLQQHVSSRQTLDLSQLLKVKGHVLCRPQLDAAVFTLTWSAVSPAAGIDVQSVRPVPIIPTALVRSLTSLGRPPPHSVNHQRGFLTMDQTRKLLLLLESDPKVSNLPLVGLWISGVTHVHNPQVWSWCLRFLCSATLQDRVLSESGHFLLVIFGSTHRAPQFFQCRGPKPGAAQLDYQLLSASQSFTLYQVAPVDGQTLQCVLAPELQSRQMQVFREAHRSFKSAAQPGTTSSINDQDSGVEDEDLSPRPSPSPHLPAQQTRRVQPSVPELSLLVDGSFTSSNHSARRESASGHKHHAPPQDKRSAPPPQSRAPKPPRRLHSTPNADGPQPCSCCTSSPPHNCTAILPPEAPVISPAPSLHLTPAPSQQLAPPTSAHQPACHLPPPSVHPSPLPCFPASDTRSTPPSNRHSAPLFPHKSSPPTLPPPSTVTSAPTLHWSHPSPVPWCGDSTPSPHPASPPWPSVSSRQPQTVPSDVHQLLLQQDQQLRLLQAQVQMLLEAQSKLQSCQKQADTQTQRSLVSIAVGTGASLCWTDPGPPQEVQNPRVDTPTPPSTPQHPAACSLSSSEPVSTPRPSMSPPSSGPPCTPPAPSTSSGPHSFPQPEAGDEDSDNTVQGNHSSHFSFEGLQSPVLGESASMYNPEVQQQNFYQDLMTQLTSRLQEPDSPQNQPAGQWQQPDSRVEAEPLRRRSLPVTSHSTRRKQQNQNEDDPVVSATLRRLQQLGVSVDKEDVLDCDRKIQKTVESTSTLACINPAAVLTRLGVSEPPGSILFPGHSVDLSLEANAIALRYLNDAQLSRLSLEGRASAPAAPASSTDSLLSPSNMSIATRKYMRRYGLIEEGEGEEDSEEEVPETSHRQPLGESHNVRRLVQGELIQDLGPKMQLLKEGGRSSRGKENSSNRRPSLARAGSLQTEGSVGNILDLSRLRQLPKLF